MCRARPRAHRREVHARALCSLRVGPISSRYRDRYYTGRGGGGLFLVVCKRMTDLTLLSNERKHIRITKPTMQLGLLGSAGFGGMRSLLATTSWVQIHRINIDSSIEFSVLQIRSVYKELLRCLKLCLLPELSKPFHVILLQTNIDKIIYFDKYGY